MRTIGLPLCSALLVAACGSSPSSSTLTPDVAADGATPQGDAYAGAAGCASTFGAALTNAFGRLDGTVLAVLPPGNTTCAAPNSTHVVIEVMMGGAAYRMVTNVLSTSADPRVFLDEVDAPLAGGPWQEGWHPGVQLDYVTTLHVASTAFAAASQADAVGRIEREVVVGAHVSVFATSAGGTTADSAHLIHRNLASADGAIVLTPDTAPRYLLTRFSEQTF
jgi:hypothetical protein